MRSYETISVPNPRVRRTLLVAVAEAKKGIWAQNCEGNQINKDDK